MTIGYLVNCYPRPSHSFIRREIRALERAGHRVHRFAIRGDFANLVDPADRSEHERTERILEAGSTRLLAATLGAAARAPRTAVATLSDALAMGHAAGARARHLVYLAEACRLADRCRALGIAHLHAHFGTNSAAVALLAARLAEIPFSLTVHGPEEFDAARALSLRLKVRRAAFTIAISAFGRSQICRFADPADWDRIRVVHCGIEPGRFASLRPLPEGGPRLVAIGRLAEEKGFLVLLDALARARRERPDLRLTLVGDGPMRPAIEAARARLGLEDAVVLAGWRDEAGVREALAEASALVVPSFAEGLPVVIMEAMAAGRPVIATFVAGIPELVRPGTTGWLVPAGDADALASSLVALADTPRERLVAMGLAGRERALARHDVDRCAAELAARFRGGIAPERAQAPLPAPAPAA